MGCPVAILIVIAAGFVVWAKYKAPLTIFWNKVGNYFRGL